MKKIFVFLFIVYGLSISKAEDGLIWKTEDFMERCKYSFKEKVVFCIDGSNFEKIDINNGNKLIQRKFKYVRNDFVVLPSDTNLLLSLKIASFAIYNIKKDTILQLIEIPNFKSTNAVVHLITKSKDNSYLIANFKDSSINNFVLLDLEQNKVASTLQDNKADYRDNFVYDDFSAMYFFQKIAIVPQQMYEYKLVKFSLLNFTHVDTFRININTSNFGFNSSLCVSNKEEVDFVGSEGNIYLINESHNNDLIKYSSYQTIEMLGINKGANFNMKNLINISDNGIHYFYNYDLKKIKITINSKTFFDCFNRTITKVLGSGILIYNIEIQTGVEPKENTSVFNLYPIPIKQFFTIPIENSIQVTIIVSNNLGQVTFINIYNNIIDNKITINCVNWNSGKYNTIEC